MTKIIAAPLTRFRVQQHLHLMTETSRLLKEEEATLGVQALATPLQEAIETETIAFEVEQGSILTKKLDDKDMLRERYSSGFGYLVEMGLYHFDASVEEAALVIKRLVDKYGNMRAKTNAEETVAIRNLNGELKSEAILPYTNKLGGLVWVNKIDEENEAYSTLFGSRNKENVERPSGSTRDARLVTDPCYIAIVERINALTIVNGEANYLSFITQLNGIIEGLKTTMALQQAAKKNPETATAAK